MRKLVVLRRRCASFVVTLFAPLEQAVIESAPLPCDYALPALPVGEHLDLDKVNLDYAMSADQKLTFPRASSQAACADQAAWYYDDRSAPKLTRMCPAGCAAIKAVGTIQIQLGCATVSLN
jgi:hypothetical protein